MDDGKLHGGTFVYGDPLQCYSGRRYLYAVVPLHCGRGPVASSLVPRRSTGARLTGKTVRPLALGAGRGRCDLSLEQSVTEILVIFHLSLLLLSKNARFVIS